jgi:hypothetical protein
VIKGRSFGKNEDVFPLQMTSLKDTQISFFGIRRRDIYLLSKIRNDSRRTQDEKLRYYAGKTFPNSTDSLEPIPATNLTGVTRPGGSRNGCSNLKWSNQGQYHETVLLNLPGVFSCS